MPPTVPTPAQTTASPVSGGEGGIEGERGVIGAIKDKLGLNKPPAIQTSEEQQSQSSPSPFFTSEKSEFVIKESTGGQIGKRGEKRPGVKEEVVAFNQELASQYKNFLKDHLQNLLKITNPQVLDNATHRHELQMREALTTDGKPDEAKIEAYLKSPDGWMITTQLLEDQTALKLFAIGLYAATRPKGARIEQLDQDTIRLHLDQGRLNKFLMDRLWPWLNERINVTAGRPEERGYAGGQRRFFGLDLSDIRRWQSMLGQTTGAAIIGTPAFLATLAYTHELLPAAIVGYLTSRMVPGALIVRNLLNSGVTIDIRQCVGALQSIQRDANEVAYLKAVNIDVSNFVANPANNQVTLRDAHALSPNTMPEIQTEIFQGLYAREQFYTSLGIPSEQLDALPEQHLYLYYRGRAEQTGTRWQKRLEEIFQPQTTGIRDTAGRSPNTPGFDRNNSDYAGNLRRYREARRQVIVEMMEDHAIKVLDKSESEGAITRIAKKIEDRQEGGAELERRKKALGERKEALTKEKDKLTDAKTTIDAYTEAKSALDTAIAELRRDFAPLVAAAPANQPILTTIENKITSLNGQLNVVSAGSIAEARRDAKNAIAAGTTRGVNAAIAALSAAYAGITDPRVQLDQEARRQLQSAYIDQETEVGKNMLAEATQRETEAKENLKKLEELQKKIQAASRVLAEKSDAVIGTAREDLTTLSTDYGTLTGWAIAAIPLRNLSVDELMTQINAMHTADLAAAPPLAILRGWPEAQNNVHTNRTRVINAIAEAKAQFEETFDTQKGVRDPQYTRITGWAGFPPATPPITPDQLRTMSENQLLVLIHNIETASAGAEGWPPAQDPAQLPNLRLAMEGARNRMILRHNAVIAERIKDYDAQIKAQDALIGAISFGSEEDVLNNIKDLMGRQGKIFEMAYDVASNRTRYTNVAVVDPNDTTYTATEKAAFDGAVPPVGYWEIMDALFDYRKRTDRTTYVSKILKTLPPKALARRINLATGMAPNHANIEDITVALNQLQTSIGNRTFTGIDTRRMFRDIINGLGEQADAI